MSRMIVRCDMLEDEELLALASQCFTEMDFADEVILISYEISFGPVDECFHLEECCRIWEKWIPMVGEKILPASHVYSYRKERACSRILHSPFRKRIGS